MSLSAILSVFDDVALVSLASKGLVRRAARDCAGDKLKILETDDLYAKCLVDGEDVFIDEKGPAEAQCSCAATGVCRHILTVVMALRERPQSDLEKPLKTAPKTAQKTATDEISELDNGLIRKFAGSDYDKALQLADSSAASTISQAGANVCVALSDSPASVTFIAGQSLKAALYKGPVTKQRLITAAAAILIRRSQGVADTPTEDKDAPPQGLSGDFLEDAIGVIEKAVTGVLMNTSPLAGEALFNLSISARAEAAPRLASELRLLSGQAALAPLRHVDFHGDRFLTACARTYALCRALRRSPDDRRLTGILKRDYQLTEPESLIALGARKWKTPAGARGLTAYFLNNENMWRTMTVARAAGQDFLFNPLTAYESALWGAGVLKSLMGKHLRLPEPRIAGDGSIAGSLTSDGEKLKDKVNFNDLDKRGAIFDDWGVLQEDVFARLGAGLGRVLTPLPFLIKPAKFGGFGYDDLRQCYEWEMVDKFGAALPLRLPGDDAVLANRLRTSSLIGKALLIAVQSSTDGLFATPVSILEGANDLNIFNIGLDSWHRESLVDRGFKKLRDRVAAPSKVKARIPDAIDNLTAAAIGEALSAILGGQHRLSTIAEKAQQSGLTLLAGQIRIGDEDPTPNNLMRIVYISDEIRLMNSRL